jgi:predicted metalloprotease
MRFNSDRLKLEIKRGRKPFGILLVPIALAGVALHLATAHADGGSATASTPAAKGKPAAPQSLVIGAEDGGQPKDMEQFLTAVTKDVDRYWTTQFKDSDLPEPRVSYRWIPAGQTAASACGAGSADLGDSAAAYCPGDDTIYISEKFATDIFNGSLDSSLPGSSQGYGGTRGDVSVAYIVAHEYGHEVQNELGVDQQGLPTMSLELQADCYAGNWAKNADDEHRLEQGDLDEALNSALAVGDFDTSQPGHHGTPEQRKEAFTTGFESGDPTTCNQYLPS